MLSVEISSSMKARTCTTPYDKPVSGDVPTTLVVREALPSVFKKDVTI